MLEGGVQPVFTNAARGGPRPPIRRNASGFAASWRLNSGMSREPHLFPPEDDPIEVWGRRIGRALAVLACIVLAAYLILTYLR